MGGDDYRRVRAVVADDGAEDIVPGGRIHAADGLIQQIEPGTPAHHQDQLHLLPGALGHLLDALTLIDAQTLQHLLGHVPAEVGVEVAEEIQQLGHVHPGGQIGPLRQVGDDLLGLLAGGHPVNEDLPGGGGQQAVGQLDERGFAAAVGAQQPHDPARLNGQIHAAQRQSMPIAFGQAITL